VEENFDEIAGDLVPQAALTVKNAREKANPTCVRCETPIKVFHMGCDRGHRSCQSCYNVRDKLEVNITMRNGDIRHQCAIEGCKGSIPVYNRDTCGTPKWSTMVDKEENDRLAQSQKDLTYILIGHTAQAHANRHLLSEERRKAEQRGATRATRQLGSGRGERRRNPPPTFEGCLRKHAQMAGCTYDDLILAKKTRKGCRGVMNALADAEAEWEEVSPRAKAKRRAAEMAEENKEKQANLAKIENLTAANEELTSNLEGANEQIASLKARVKKLRGYCKKAKLDKEHAEEQLANFEKGAGSSSTSATGKRARDEAEEPQEGASDDAW
jgi:hypothetical protein